MMKTHRLVQGSPEWLAHRSNFWNASDAPAMLGLSKYETREQMLHRLSTGIRPEIDDRTAALFADGHRCEALARPLAEEIIGDELYPVTGSRDKLSASFDGLTMDRRTNFEHKRMNNALREVFAQPDPAKALTLDYCVQMEHQCIVSESERTLFMASNWDQNGNLVEVAHLWYTSNPELRARVLAGWVQLEKDKAAYVPKQSVAVVIARPVTDLPSVSVKVQGKIDLVSNLPTFAAALQKFIDNDFIVKPKTDQDFADLELQVKALSRAEDDMDTVTEMALSQVEAVQLVTTTAARLKELARRYRLLGAAAIKTEKENRKNEIVAAGITALRDHYDALNKRIGKLYLQAIPADFGGVIRGMKKLDNMEAAIKTELGRVKSLLDTAAAKIEANLATLREQGAEHAALFADEATLVLKSNDDLVAVVKNRIAEHEKQVSEKLEAQRAQIRKEELERIESERLEKERVDREAAETKRLADLAAREAKEEQEWADAQASMNKPVSEQSAAPAPALIASVAIETVAPAENVVAMVRPATPTAVTPDLAATIRLGQINDALAPYLQVSAANLQALGFPSIGKAGAATLYRAADLPLILAALIDQLQAVQSKQAA